MLLYGLVLRCLDRLSVNEEPAVWGTYEAIFDFWMELREKIARRSVDGDALCFYQEQANRFAKHVKTPESIGPYASNWIRETSPTLKARSSLRIDVRTDTRRVYVRVLSDVPPRGNGEQLTENLDRARQRSAIASFEEAASPVITLVRDQVKPLNTISYAQPRKRDYRLSVSRITESKYGNVPSLIVVAFVVVAAFGVKAANSAQVKRIEKKLESSFATWPQVFCDPQTHRPYAEIRGTVVNTNEDVYLVRIDAATGARTAIRFPAGSLRQYVELSLNAQRVPSVIYRPNLFYRDDGVQNEGNYRYTIGMKTFAGQLVLPLERPPQRPYSDVHVGTCP